MYHETLKEEQEEEEEEEEKQQQHLRKLKHTVNEKKFLR